MERGRTCTGMHGYVYNPMFQSLAGAGYAVILLNPRGSNGYGQVSTTAHSQGLLHCSDSAN